MTVPALVPAATAGNLTNLVAERAWFEPERIMLSRPLGQGWQEVTAREFESEVRAAAKGLIAAGVQIGDRVAIMARTRYEWTILDFAIWFAGGCVVPIFETSSADQVEWILSDSGAVAIIVETPTHRDLVSTVLPAHTKKMWTITEEAMHILSTSGEGVSDEEIDRRRNASVPDTLATLIYTSGTTGKPKGVQLTHGNFLAECGNVVQGAPDLFLKPGGSTLLFLPVDTSLDEWCKLGPSAPDCIWRIAATRARGLPSIWAPSNQPSFWQFHASLKKSITEPKHTPRRAAKAGSSERPLASLSHTAKQSTRARYLYHC